jgi:nucleotide-binding universal stress UspA family protein
MKLEDNDDSVNQVLEVTAVSEDSEVEILRYRLPDEYIDISGRRSLPETCNSDHMSWTHTIDPYRFHSSRSMFSKIVVALNDLPESQRALRAAIDLARTSNAELATVSILGDLPAYTSFAIVVDPNAPNTMKDGQHRAHGELHEKASRLAQEHGVRSRGSIVEGREVQAILHFLKDERADLFVIGLHQHDFYISRLWSSVYDLAQEAPCSVLGVH